MTPNKVIKRALRLIGKFESGQPIDATDLQDALLSLNQMITGWELDGICLGLRDLQLSLNMPVEDVYENAIVYNLAVELAPEYGLEAKTSVAFKAESFKDKVRNDLLNIRELTFDELPIEEYRYNIDES